MRALMEPLKNELLSIPRTKFEVSQIIGKLISEKFRIDVIQADAQEVDVGDINFTAEYDCEKDSMNRPCIELYIVYSPLDDMVLFDQELFDTVTKRLCDSISHEQIHQRQCRSRYWEDFYDVDTDDTVAYLSNKDEIDAYSYNIANELLDSLDYQKVLTLLQEPSTISIEHSVNLWTYLETFKDTNHPVIKRLLKKVIKHLPLVETER
jgi:hypothetical protein